MTTVHQSRERRTLETDENRRINYVNKNMRARERSIETRLTENAAIETTPNVSSIVIANYFVRFLLKLISFCFFVLMYLFLL